MYTLWAKALQNCGFTVKHVPGGLNVVPDALSQSLGEIDSGPVSHEPSLASFVIIILQARDFVKFRTNRYRRLSMVRNDENVDSAKL